MKTVLIVCCVLPFLMSSRCGAVTEQVDETKVVQVAGFDQEHKSWSAILGRHVREDTFDYKALKKDRAQLDAYLSTLESVKADDFALWNKSRRFAFWINAYNAYTVKRVIDGYPVASIKDLGDEKVSVWDREFVPLGALAPDLKQTQLTLNDIENKILRPVFKDARVHAAINCASEGCPPIQAAAFVGDRLDAQLDTAVRNWLADKKRNRFDSSKNTVEVSQVFDWFKDDFIRDAKSVQGWIAKYAPAEETWVADARKLEVKFLEYSWKLNERR
jgi:hypothetical protein